jgi:tetratricopeptide (TPR) repeat protein
MHASLLPRTANRRLAALACAFALAFGTAGVGRAESAPSVEELIRQGREAEQRMDPVAALPFFLAADAARPQDAFILQKISRQYSDQSFLTSDPAAKRRFAETALTYAERAYALNPKSAEAALSVAICHGNLGLYGDTDAKVRHSRQIHQYAEEALRLDPNYDWAHHVLGRWHYEVAKLGMTRRFLVQLFFGGLPKASVAEAVSHLERAVALAPDTVGHQVELAFVYRSAGRIQEARAAFTRGLALPDREVHDALSKRRAAEALAALPATPVR